MMEKIKKGLKMQINCIERYTCAECLPANCGCSCSDTDDIPRPNYQIHYSDSLQRDIAKDEAISYRRI